MRRSGKGSAGESEEARQRREASQRSLERGGLPLNAVERLQEQAARQGTPRHLFTSDLSVNEMALVRHSGYEALGQEMGSSVYSVGFQWNTPNWRDSDWGRAVSFEMSVLTQAFYNARHLALGRLRQEAAMLGATGVVGVRLERSGDAWADSLLEFVAIGTAIRESGRAHPQPAGGASEHPPFLSNLSGQEFWALRQAHYRPAGLVVGNCAFYQIASAQTRLIAQSGWAGSWQNLELTEYTQALYQARTLAMERLEGEARAVAAEGVVGVEVEIKAEPRHMEQNNQQTWVGMLYHFTAIGTAIAPAPGTAPAASPDTMIWLR